MVIELIRKEMINRRAKKTSSIYARLLKVFLKLVFYALIVTAICFVFTSLDNKIRNYSQYGTFDFLVLALFAVMVVGVISSTARARKVMFNKEDARITTTLPISNEVLVFSKVVYVYIKECFTSLILATPMLFCYGLVRVEPNPFPPSYYIFALFYPFIISLFTIGVSLIFVVLYEYIYRIIKTKDMVQFVLASIIVIGLCFVYQFVLNLFLSALNDSSIGGMFSLEFVNALHDLASFMLPVYNLLTSVINNFNQVSNWMIFIGLTMVVLVVGFYVVATVFHYFNVHDLDIRSKHVHEKEIKIVSPFKALLNKEIDMLFKDSAYTFSYTSLLIMAPFLSFVVISSLNGIIYKNLEFFLVYYPELINGINIVLVLLFMSVINSSATLSMSREGKSVQIVKYIPVSLQKQILAKILTPMVLSFISLTVTCVTLIITNSITFATFGMVYLIGTILIVVSNIYGILWDMHDKSASKVKLSSLNTVLAVGYPCLILLIHLLLSFLGVQSYIIYLSEAILTLILFVICFIRLKKRFAKAFLKMEAH